MHTEVCCKVLKRLGKKVNIVCHTLQIYYAFLLVLVFGPLSFGLFYLSLCHVVFIQQASLFRTLFYMSR